MLRNCFGILETWFRDPKKAASGLKCWQTGGSFFKILSIAEVRPNNCSHYTASGSSGTASGAVLPQTLVPTPRLAHVVLLCGETQRIMKPKNKINAPSLWGYFPTGLVPLMLWGHGYGVRMWYGVRGDLCWRELLCCSWWNTAILLNSPKPCDLPNPKIELGKWNVLAFFWLAVF